MQVQQIRMSIWITTFKNLSVLINSVNTDKTDLPLYKLLPLTVQGDQAACPKPTVDIDVKVVFSYKGILLNLNFKSMSTGGFGQAAWSPCTQLPHRFEHSSQQLTTCNTTSGVNILYKLYPT